MQILSPRFTSAIKNSCSEAEWRIRVDLAACYRLIAHFGMSDLIYNHITARVPETEDYWLEMACKVQVDVMAAERHIDLPSQAILEKTYGLYQPSVRLFGEREWPAMLRMLNRRDPSYLE